MKRCWLSVAFRRCVINNCTTGPHLGGCHTSDSVLVLPIRIGRRKYVQDLSSAVDCHYGALLVNLCHYRFASELLSKIQPNYRLPLGWAQAGASSRGLGKDSSSVRARWNSAGPASITVITGQIQRFRYRSTVECGIFPVARPLRSCRYITLSDRLHSGQEAAAGYSPHARTPEPARNGRDLENSRVTGP